MCIFSPNFGQPFNSTNVFGAVFLHLYICIQFFFFPLLCPCLVHVWYMSDHVVFVPLAHWQGSAEYVHVPGISECNSQSGTSVFGPTNWIAVECSTTKTADSSCMPRVQARSCPRLAGYCTPRKKNIARPQDCQRQWSAPAHCYPDQLGAAGKTAVNLTRPYYPLHRTTAQWHACSFMWHFVSPQWPELNPSAQYANNDPHPLHPRYGKVR